MAGMRNWVERAGALAMLSAVLQLSGCATAEVAAVASVAPLSAADCRQMAERHALLPENPVACPRLRAVNFSYYSDEGRVEHDGRVVVLDVFAPQVVELFADLYRRHFYIHQARPLETFDGSDAASMDANNSSAFNGRPIAGSRDWSLNAYGAAIDVNPLQNPAIYPGQQADANGNPAPGIAGTALVRPKAAANPDNDYLNRTPYRARPDDDGFFRPGMAESVVDVFADHGFLTWGGYWNDPLAYQHFQVGARDWVARMYAADPPDAADPEKGRALFDEYRGAYRKCLHEYPRAWGREAAKEKARAYCAREVVGRYGV